MSELETERRDSKRVVLGMCVEEEFGFTSRSPVVPGEMTGAPVHDRLVDD